MSLVEKLVERAQGKVKHELEHATAEFRRRARPFAAGAVLAVAAAVLLLFAVGFALASLAAGIASWLPHWAALLVVAGALLLLAGALGGVAAQLLRKRRAAPRRHKH